MVRKLFHAGICLSLSLSTISMAFAQGRAPEPGVSPYAPIDIEQVRTLAKTELQNARAAGRLSKDEDLKFQQELDNATSLSQVESLWAELEAKAQEAKSNHLSIDHLLKNFSYKLDNLEKKGLLSVADAKFYRDRVTGIYRLKKTFTANGKRLDFWQFIVLALDLSNVEERLTRAMWDINSNTESFDDLVLRSDMYLARNEVCARQLGTFKSYIREPAQLVAAKNQMIAVLRDKANSRIQTPQVRQELTDRLIKATHYEADKQLPSEENIDYAIKEVQRLIDSGIKNGNIGHSDATKLQQELELVKQLQVAYPSNLPGIDPFERELRLEELRFMAVDLRYMQDWLARLLRKDGDADESREQLLAAIRRTNLAYFTHRISREDASSILALAYDAFRTKDSAKQLNICNEIQGKLSMMIADYSWKPVDVQPRLAELGQLISKLNQSDSVSSEKNRIEGMLRSLPQNTNTEKIGANIVAGAELEILRNKVRALLKAQHLQTANAEASAQ